MKKFMSTEELARDDRFERTPVPLDFLMAEEVTVEQVEETMLMIMGNDEVREHAEQQASTGGAQPASTGPTRGGRCSAVHKEPDARHLGGGDAGAGGRRP